MAQTRKPSSNLFDHVQNGFLLLDQSPTTSLRAMVQNGFFEFLELLGVEIQLHATRVSSWLSALYQNLKALAGVVLREPHQFFGIGSGHLPSDDMELRPADPLQLTIGEPGPPKRRSYFKQEICCSASDSRLADEASEFSMILLVQLDQTSCEFNRAVRTARRYIQGLLKQAHIFVGVFPPLYHQQSLPPIDRHRWRAPPHLPGRGTMEDLPGENV